MPRWPWWVGGLAVAAIPILHFVVFRRMLAVSGRFTALVNRLRFGKEPESEEMSAEELIQAMRLATAAEFGDAAVESEPLSPPAAAPWLEPTRGAASHFVFFAGLVLGGAGSALAAGAWSPQLVLRGELFTRTVGSNPMVQCAVLLLGGVLVGFGTRMAGGCTSGHGLCGVSRFQRGSLLATAAFFAAGIAASLLLGMMA